MVQIYTPKYKKELVKDEAGHDENDNENAKKLESQSRARLHQAFKKSDYYEHVKQIVEDWLDTIKQPGDFPPEELVKLSPEELKELTIVGAKCKAEAKRLIKRLS